MSGPRILTLEERFWSKVAPDGERSPEQCWTWEGSCDGHGYGMFRVPQGTRRAHRIAYEFFHGPVPDGTVFLHSCDNPPCCNPDHLSIGTRAENNADRDAKGRHWTHTGEQHGMAKLTRPEVDQIRAWRSYGFRLHEIGAWFGVSGAHVSRLAHGKSWSAA